MSYRKDILFLITTIFFLVILIGSSLILKKDKNTDLPTVNENTTAEDNNISDVVNEEDTIDYSNITLPISDSNTDNGFLITDDSTNDETTTEVNSEAISKDISELNKDPEQVLEENKAIEEAKEQANKNENVVTINIETEDIEIVEEPKRDANGFIYTKEEAIAALDAVWKRLEAENDFNVTYAWEVAQMQGQTREEFDANVHLMLTDPYSSTVLPTYFDDYRKRGDLGILVGCCSLWLGSCGDEGVVNYMGIQ